MPKIADAIQDGCYVLYGFYSNFQCEIIPNSAFRI